MEPVLSEGQPTPVVSVESVLTQGAIRDNPPVPAVKATVVRGSGSSGAGWAGASRQQSSRASEQSWEQSERAYSQRQ